MGAVTWWNHRNGALRLEFPLSICSFFVHSIFCFLGSVQIPIFHPKSLLSFHILFTSPVIWYENLSDCPIYQAPHGEASRRFRASWDARDIPSPTKPWEIWREPMKPWPKSSLAAIDTPGWWWVRVLYYPIYWGLSWIITIHCASPIDCAELFVSDVLSVGTPKKPLSFTVQTHTILATLPAGWGTNC